MEFREQYDIYARMVEFGLERYLPNTQIPQAKLLDAMLYSVFSGGKRVRPVLLLAFCDVLGGHVEAALPFACALEMIHTYSLIHDDLPCMDDDDLRRGRPTNHRMFGEASAVLAGDALLSAAFETMLDADYIKDTPPATVIKVAHRIAWASGLYGMAGGQLLDMEAESFDAGLEGAAQIHMLKTASLLDAAAVAGCLLAGASEEQLSAASSYGRCVGIAFQIQDDLLGAHGDPACTGKNVGGDEQRHKTTFVSLLGREECRRLITSLTEQALSFLEPFGHPPFLIDMTRALAERDG